MRCFCYRLYHKRKPCSTTVHAFSGSLCRVQSFKTVDGLRFCLVIFSLSDYKHLHFPHEEYKWLISNLYALQSVQTILPTVNNTHEQKLNDGVLSVKHQPFINDFKIKFGDHSLTVGPVTAFGLVKTTPFADVDVFHVNQFTCACDPKWDICTCGKCPAFKYLVEYEATAVKEILQCRPENVFLFH